MINWKDIKKSRKNKRRKRNKKSKRNRKNRKSISTNKDKDLNRVYKSDKNLDNDHIKRKNQRKEDIVILNDHL